MFTLSRVPLDKSEGRVPQPRSERLGLGFSHSKRVPVSKLVPTK